MAKAGHRSRARKKRCGPTCIAWRKELAQAAETACLDDYRDAYNRVVKARGQDAMAQVEAESCGGCHQQLTPNIMSQLSGARAVFCKTCGRLLYLPEDRTPVRK